MNKFIQNLFLILLPFYPFWAWLFKLLTNKPVDVFVTVGLIPVIIYLFLFEKIKLPKYLIFLLIFTLYHIASIFFNDIFPDDVNKFFFLLSDNFILACLLFIIIENTIFDKEFINKISILIFIVVIISLITSVIQIKNPNFFTSNSARGSFYLENRNFSIYSWTNLNSLGISFPILISILLSYYSNRKYTLPILILSGIIVSFLSKARYVMLSTLVVFSQLFLNSKISIFKKASIVFAFIAMLVLINFAAYKSGYDINEVINNRILEKDSDLGSAKARITSYYVFLQVFPDNPWLGIGPRTEQRVVDLLGGEAYLIHVGYLSYLYFYGIIGCIILFFAIFFLLRNAWIVGKTYDFWGGLYGLISFCLANLTFVYFNFSEMGIVIALIYLRFYNYKSSSKLVAKIKGKENYVIFRFNQTV